MPDKGTNNVAEYKALIDGLEMAKENSITKINIQGDSQLIINQMTGVYKVKAENLIQLYEKNSCCWGWNSWLVNCFICKKILGKY